jgi:SRSO17 transposase
MRQFIPATNLAGKNSIMEQRYQQRLDEMLKDAEVSPVLLSELLPRLERFVTPFTVSLVGAQQRTHVAEYLTGLLSNLRHKTGEAIAYLHDQERQGIQKFIGHVPWDHRPLLATLVGQVGEQLGEPDAVLVFDPSGFPKKGPKSVGVARQWCGRLGKVDNCQVGVYMAYVSRKEHALVNFRLYLPEDWAKDRPRRYEAGVPRSIKFQTRHELTLEMLEECGVRLPHAWVAGDDEMGRPASFRRELAARGERYLLAVPSNTLIRDADVAPPEYSGRGRHPKSPFTRVDRWCAVLSERAWTRIDVRDGEKGPLVIDVVKCRVQARTESGGTGPDELLFVTRERQADGTDKHDFYLSNAEASTALRELARVAKAAHRVEECLKRAKGDAGLGDYQVRTWLSWHHHQTLSLLAAWFLNEETRRGKNQDPGADVTAAPPAGCGLDRLSSEHQSSIVSSSPRHSLAPSQRNRPIEPSSVA